MEYIQNCDATPINTESTNPAEHKQYNLAWLDKLIRTKVVIPLSSVRQVFTSWNIFASAFGYFVVNGISNTFMSWIPMYLVTVKGFTTIKMGFVASAPFVGAVIGNLLGGLISDRFLEKRRKPMMMLSVIGTIFTLYSLVYAPNSPIYLGAMLMLAGMVLGLGYAGYAVYPMGLATKETFPLCYGVINTGGQLGTAITPIIVGYLLDNFSWDSVFLYLSFSSIISFIVLATTDEPANDVSCEIRK